MWRAQHPADGPFGNCTYAMKVMDILNRHTIIDLQFSGVVFASQ